MDFLKHREGGMVFYQFFSVWRLYCRNMKGLREIKEIEILRKSCRGGGKGLIWTTHSISYPAALGLSLSLIPPKAGWGVGQRLVTPGHRVLIPPFL
jgi:hypothetical protein